MISSFSEHKVSVNTRKQKVIFFYELDVTVDWRGKLSDTGMSTVTFSSVGRASSTGAERRYDPKASSRIAELILL